jgi:hypothetical protein
MSGSGFFKGEKKKQKKDKEKRSGIITGNAPVFTAPKVIVKKRSEH